MSELYPRRLTEFVAWANQQQTIYVIDESRWVTSVQLGRASDNTAAFLNMTLHQLEANGFEGNKVEQMAELTFYENGNAEGQIWDGEKYNDLIFYNVWEGVESDQFDLLFVPFLAKLKSGT